MENAIEIYPALTDENKRLLTAYLADLARIEHIDPFAFALRVTTDDK